MKLRKIKKKVYFKYRFSRKGFLMKFIELRGNAYPLNDRVIFVTETKENGSHELYLSYTDNLNLKVLCADITNQRELSLKEKIEIGLRGKNIFSISI